MVYVSIVEDDTAYADILQQYLARYGEENGVEFRILRYRTGASFLEHHSAETDIVFMDIDLPGIDGMQTAISLREVNQLAVLIFVTNLTQYAIQGYAVNALDYIVKPVSYSHFAIKLERALQRLSEQKAYYMIRTNEGFVRMACDLIYYVEGQRHRLLFHTAKGVIPMWGTLKAVEQELCNYGFSRPGKSFLLNLRHIQAIRNNRVLLHGQEFSIGRSRKAAFMDDFTAYLGGGVLLE